MSKIEIGTTNIKKPIIFDDMESKEFKKHCREYIDYYRDEINEFASEILIDAIDEGINIDPITENCCPKCKINQNKIKSQEVILN